MAEEKKRDWLDTIAKLLIPVVIFVVGQQYACQKDMSGAVGAASLDIFGAITLSLVSSGIKSRPYRILSVTILPPSQYRFGHHKFPELR